MMGISKRRTTTIIFIIIMSGIVTSTTTTTTTAAANVSLTVQLITVSVLILQRQLQHKQISRNETVIPPNGYDYVIVGSGSAGAVVANRLAALRRYRILLLEAGGPQTVDSDQPALTVQLTGSNLDWQYLTVPQQNIAQSLIDHRVRQPKGRVIGGTSTINWMLYNRGNRRSYDNWARTYGCTGWDYESVLPYFRRSENNTSPEIVNANPGYHGTNGPLGVSSDPHPDPILYLFQDQMNSFGIPTVDINGPNQTGTMIYQLNIKHGVRSSTGNAFIDPNPYPDYLDIYDNALVTRILFDQSDSGNIHATGVQFFRNGQNYTVMANREVIVSAGCIGSPQLLLLSGIGPRDHLESLGIPVVANLPVGENFQDHVFIHNYYRIKNSSLVNEPVGPTVRQLYEFYTNGSGRMIELPNSITFFSTRTNDDPDFPNAVIDVNTYLADNIRNVTELVTSSYGTNQDEWIRWWSPLVDQKLLVVTSAIYRTYSRGTIRLNSSDPFEHPLIDPQYLSDQRDVEALVDMTKMLFYLTQTGELPKYAELHPLPIPGCNFCPGIPLHQCDSYVRCIIRQTGDTALHPGGACRMGSIDRSDVVVDPQLRVIGINRLRVIDSSVIPELANANTNAASIMIGERGVQFIIDELQQQMK